MKLNNKSTIMQTTTETMIHMVVSAWRGQNQKLNQFLEKIPEEKWLAETAPGRNTGIYLLGHLTAVNDGMLSLLRFRERMHPELDEIFLTNADKSGLSMPSVTALKEYWHAINAALDQHIDQMTPEEWFTRHAAISEEDFQKEPHRNRLNILINRSIHQSYHLGQIAYL
jgi:uncharacterized damage-inducible protein DinB